MDKKEYWIKITMEDYGIILKAYAVAVFYLATQYPEPKRGRDSDWKKNFGEKLNKITQTRLVLAKLGKIGENIQH